MFSIAIAKSNVARRALSTASNNIPKNPLVPKQLDTSFKKNFLSDPSTYPLIAIMAAASSVCVGMSANGALRYKGIKVRPEHKNSMMSKESHTPYQGVTEFITRRPWGFHASKLGSLRSEGMGIDHEEWKKNKAAYDGVHRA